MKLDYRGSFCVCNVYLFSCAGPVESCLKPDFAPKCSEESLGFERSNSAATGALFSAPCSVFPDVCSDGDGLFAAVAFEATSLAAQGECISRGLQPPPTAEAPAPLIQDASLKCRPPHPFPKMRLFERPHAFGVWTCIDAAPSPPQTDRLADIASGVVEKAGLSVHRLSTPSRRGVSPATVRADPFGISALKKRDSMREASSPSEPPAPLHSVGLVEEGNCNSSTEIAGAPPLATVSAEAAAEAPSSPGREESLPSEAAAEPLPQVSVSSLGETFGSFSVQSRASREVLRQVASLRLVPGMAFDSALECFFFPADDGELLAFSAKNRPVKKAYLMALDALVQQTMQRQQLDRACASPEQRSTASACKAGRASVAASEEDRFASEELKRRGVAWSPRPAPNAAPPQTGPSLCECIPSSAENRAERASTPRRSDSGANVSEALLTLPSEMALGIGALGVKEGDLELSRTAVMVCLADLRDLCIARLFQSAFDRTQRWKRLEQHLAHVKDCRVLQLLRPYVHVFEVNFAADVLPSQMCPVTQRILFSALDAHARASEASFFQSYF